MSRYTPTTVATLIQVNSELTKVATAIDTMLDREGTSPNQMGADLDLNGNSLLNAVNLDISNDEAPEDGNQYVRQDGEWVVSSSGGGSYRGLWDALETSYLSGDTVKDGVGDLYLCLLGGTTEEPSGTATDWQYIATGEASSGGGPTAFIKTVSVDSIWSPDPDGFNYLVMSPSASANFNEDRYLDGVYGLFDIETIYDEHGSSDLNLYLDMELMIVIDTSAEDVAGWLLTSPINFVEMGVKVGYDGASSVYLPTEVVNAVWEYSDTDDLLYMSLRTTQAIQLTSSELDLLDDYGVKFKLYLRDAASTSALPLEGEYDYRGGSITVVKEELTA